MSNTGIWFKGNLQVAILAPGTTTVNFNNLALSDALNGTKVTVKPDGDKKTRISNMIEDFGQTREIRYQPKPTEIEFAFDEPTKELIAAALLGTSSTFSQSAVASGTVTRTLVLGKWTTLDAINLDTVTISGKTEGVDFAVNRTLGQIKPLKSEMAVEQTITRTAKEVSGDKIIGATESVIDMALLMHVQNNSDGRSGILQIPKVSVIPSKVFEFLGAKDFQEVAFKGDIVSIGPELYTFKPNLVFGA